MSLPMCSASWRTRLSKNRFENIREISELLIGAMGGSHARINLGDEPVILAAEQLVPTELMEMDKEASFWL